MRRSHLGDRKLVRMRLWKVFLVMSILPMVGCCVGSIGFGKLCNGEKIGGDAECGLVACVSVGGDSVDYDHACTGTSIGPAWYAYNHHHSKTAQLVVMAIVTTGGKTERYLQSPFNLGPDSKQFLGCSKNLSNNQDSSFELSKWEWK
jgi:hypothetical protein